MIDGLASHQIYRPVPERAADVTWGNAHDLAATLMKYLDAPGVQALRRNEDLAAQVGDLVAEYTTNWVEFSVRVDPNDGAQLTPEDLIVRRGEAPGLWVSGPLLPEGDELEAPESRQIIPGSRWHTVIPGIQIKAHHICHDWIRVRKERLMWALHEVYPALKESPFSWDIGREVDGHLEFTAVHNGRQLVVQYRRVSGPMDMWFAGVPDRMPSQPSPEAAVAYITDMVARYEQWQ